MTFWKKKSDKTEPAAPAPQQDTPNPERNNMNELVLQSIHEGVVFVGPEGNVHLANPVASELLGRNYDEIIGLNYESVFVLLDKTGAHVDTARNPIAKALQQPVFSETRDLDLVTKGSEKRTPISLTIAPTASTDGRHNLVITFRDIEKELAEEHERNEFISTASHEMRTPVASIEGYLGLALNPATATIDERARDYLTKAHESSQHLGRLFQDLLDTTKLDDGQIAPKMEAVEIVSLVKNIADAQTPNIAAKGLGYQFGNDSGEQSMSGGRRLDQLIYASVDPDFMREIMNNIIENAIKYTPAGWITINIRADQYNVQISVSDTGIGIAREELKHIFQKFYRVDNRDTREIGGTGLGLYLVKQRIEAMNGRIWAESELGKGSRFTVMLPRISQKEFEQRNFLQQNLAKQSQIPQQAL